MSYNDVDNDVTVMLVHAQTKAVVNGNVITHVVLFITHYNSSIFSQQIQGPCIRICECVYVCEYV